MSGVVPESAADRPAGATGIRQAAMLVFAAGAGGALVNSMALWLLGATAVTQALDISIAPQLSAEWLYPRIVWGGLWGFLLLLPKLPASILAKGLLLSLAPTCIQLLVVFPFKADQGLLGLQLGLLTPLLVLVVNALWGIAAAALSDGFLGISHIAGSGGTPPAR